MSQVAKIDKKEHDSIIEWIKFSNQEEFELTNFICPNDLIELLEAQFENVNYELVRNGWNHDYWYYINCGGIKITYSGDFHYGQYFLTKGEYYE